LPPTIALLAPKCRRGVVCAWAQAPGHGPGARHATRKLMAPPLRFFVLPAFLSLGNPTVPVCLPDTVRSQGFSPSQRFCPARALRLCFASHPPIGFLVFRAFPTQPAVAPLGARCSFAVSSSSGWGGFPRPRHCPSLWSSAETGVPTLFRATSHLHTSTPGETSSPSRAAEATRSGESGHAVCRGLMHSDSSRSSAVLHRSSEATSSWRGMPTLEPCSD
jgi:hypothetical protein